LKEAGGGKEMQRGDKTPNIKKNLRVKSPTDDIRKGVEERENKKELL